MRACLLLAASWLCGWRHLRWASRDLLYDLRATHIWAHRRAFALFHSAFIIGAIMPNVANSEIYTASRDTRITLRSCYLKTIFCDMRDRTVNDIAITCPSVSVISKYTILDDRKCLYRDRPRLASYCLMGTKNNCYRVTSWQIWESEIFGERICSGAIVGIHSHILCGRASAILPNWPNYPLIASQPRAEAIGNNESTVGRDIGIMIYFVRLSNSGELFPRNNRVYKDGYEGEDNEDKLRPVKGIVLTILGFASAAIGFWHAIFHSPTKRWKAFIPGLALVIIGWVVADLGLWWLI